MSHRAHRSRVLGSPLFQLEDRITPSPAGDLDPTFGIGGMATIAQPPSNTSVPAPKVSIQAMAVQPGGKIVLAGSVTTFFWYLPPPIIPPPSSFPFAIGYTHSIPDPVLSWYTDFLAVRLNADGTPDETFGAGGEVSTRLSQNFINAVAIQTDGRFVVAGHTNYTTQISRLLPDGQPDPSFQIQTISNVSGNGLAVQSDGKIVLAGATEPGAGDFVAVRFNLDGSPDGTFGVAGRVTVPFDLGGVNHDEATSVAIQPDGGIVLAGRANTPDTHYDMAAVRLRPDGTLDPTFGTGGKVTLPFEPVGGDTDEATSVAIQPDGNIVLAGQTIDYLTGLPESHPFLHIYFAAARLSPDGTPDASFGSGGRTVVDFLPGDATATALAVQRDGRVVLVGSANDNFSAARLLADGHLDPSFGTAGKVAVLFDTGGQTSDVASAVAVLPDGRILLGGNTGGTGVARVAVARLLGDPPTVTNLADQAISVNRSIGPLPFTIANGAGDPTLLTVTANSDNPTLIPDASIFLGGTGADRTLTITPLTGQSGTATITVTVRDAAGQTATETFLVTVLPPPPVPQPALAGGLPGGTARVLDPSGGPYTPGATLSFFPDFTGVVRTVTADVTGDGVPDWIGGAGPGGGPRVVVLNGATGGRIADFFAFEPTFTGGVFVAAADLDGDGRAELVVTPDGGGPLVAVFDGNGTERGRFFGIDDPAFRSGARPALGDINGDGTPDLIVSAGMGGGPRVAVFDGTSVLGGGSPVKLVTDFFAFEDTLRNGAFLAAGDVNGDGFADLTFGGGPGGAPRVRVFDRKALLAAGPFAKLDAVPSAERADFFAGDSSLRGGVRLAVKDADGDGKADLVTGSGEGEPSQVRVYKSANLLANPNPTADQELDPFGAVLADGVFVG